MPVKANRPLPPALQKRQSPVGGKAYSSSNPVAGFLKACIWIIVFIFSALSMVLEQEKKLNISTDRVEDNEKQMLPIIMSIF